MTGREILTALDDMYKLCLHGKARANEHGENVTSHTLNDQMDRIKALKLEIEQGAGK